MAALDISQFELRRAIVEIRYPNAYHLWDRAGLLWVNVRKRWPTIEMREAEPGKTLFVLDNQIELSVQPNRASFLYERPRKFEDFVERFTVFLEDINNALELIQYDRVGFRLIYHKQYPDKKSASEAMVSTNLILVPQSRQFNIDGAVLLPEYVIRIEEEKKGVAVRVKAESETQEFKPSIRSEGLKPSKTEMHRVAYDVDYYLTGTVTVEQFRPKDWLATAHHAIRRDSTAFLGG